MESERQQWKMWIQITDSCELCSQIPSRSLVFLGKWYGTYTDKPNRSWIQSAESMMANFSGSGHPKFRASSAIVKGELGSKGGGRKSIHFNGSDENIELLLRTVICANQLSVHGAMADLCNELPKDLRAPGKLAAPDHLEWWKFFLTSPLQNSTNAQQQGNLVQEYDRESEQLSEDQKLSKLCSDAGFEACRNRTILLHTWYRWRKWDVTSMPRIHNASMRKEDSSERMDSQEYENRSCLGYQSLPSWRSIQYWNYGRISLFRDRTASWVWIVSGIDKYVTESMETKEGGRAYSFGENCCRSKTTTEARSDGVLFLSLYMRESGSTTLLRNMTMIASRCQKPWYDNYDTVNQFIEKKMEQYDSMIFWRNSRKRKSMVLRSGHLTIGYLFWPKEEEPRNGFNIGWIQTLPTTSCTLEQVKDIQEVMLWILSCKTVHCYQKDLLSTSTTSGMQVKWIP